MLYMLWNLNSKNTIYDICHLFVQFFIKRNRFLPRLYMLRASLSVFQCLGNITRRVTFDEKNKHFSNLHRIVRVVILLFYFRNKEQPIHSAILVERHDFFQIHFVIHSLYATSSYGWYTELVPFLHFKDSDRAFPKVSFSEVSPAASAISQFFLLNTLFAIGLPFEKFLLRRYTHLILLNIILVYEGYLAGNMTQKMSN